MISPVILLSSIVFLGSGAVTALPKPPLPNHEGCPAEKPSEEASCVALPDQTTCNYDYAACPGGSPGVYASFCKCAGHMFFCGRAKACNHPGNLYASFPRSADAPSSAGKVIEKTAAAPPPPQDECPKELPVDRQACAVSKSETCKYNYFTCPGHSGSMFHDFCSCVDGTFSCGHAQPCAAVTTEFPSAAPSEESVESEEDVPWTYTTPSWMAAVKGENPGKKVRKCTRLQFPPNKNEACSRRKTCYWGEQACLNIRSYPTTSCACNGSNWECDSEACPGT